ncbi:MAG: hypothetical protein WC523_00090 [Patescibacteria group bacterium]
MDFFDSLNKRIEESEKRWKEITHIAEELKLLGEHDKGNCDIRRIFCIEQLVLLMIEELRPMANIGQQAKDMQNEISNMLNTFDTEVK